ncbi:MAG: EAL domain-containing protein [Gammaproteobacteria bacterium]|nr:EAL domain-containing protein [Gammaproteobacteria bacterium]HXK55104.1 EAL domain-containing protein [Gammaproteobacteria bacterium]
MQRKILESIATGLSCGQILDDLCQMIEAMVPEAQASVLQLDRDSASLSVLAGTTFPPEMLACFDRMLHSADMETGKDAAGSGKPCYVIDVSSDPHWNRFGETAGSPRIGAFWSVPFFSEKQQMLGTFSIISKKRGAPTPFHSRMLEIASFLAGITIRNREREESLLQWSTVFRDASEGMIITNAHGAILDVNQSFTNITGYSKDEVLGKNPNLLNSGRQDKAFFLRLWDSLRETGKWQGEIWNRRKSGDIYPEWLSISRIDNKEGKPFNYVAVFSDISSLKESERKLYHLAHHDPLTGLPNRLLMIARLEHALKQSLRNPTLLALMFIDLDRFKNVNDSYGHALGDQLLVNVARRLKSHLRSGDTIARIGGDEFVVLLEQLRQADQAAALAQSCIDALARPFAIAGQEIFITPSIGISLFPGDGSDAESLLKHADIAMYRSKEEGRHRYSFFTKQLSDKVKERLKCETLLRRALERREFELHYQPQVGADSGRIVGAEALLRWNHPEQGQILPNMFIPVLEETGLIQEVGAWALKTACRQMQDWEELGLPKIRLAVNLSAKQVSPESTSHRLQTILAESGLSPNRLELEITEHSIMQGTEKGNHLLNSLRELGVSLAIDDFGTGYSSLMRLKQLPVHCLKIEQTLVRDIPDDQDDQAICRAVVALGHSLGVRIVAEGVEREEQADFLRSIGCDELQGYLYGRPMAADKFEQLLADR